MRRNVVLSTYNRAAYFDQTQEIMQEKRVPKISLRVRFITRLNTFARVGACACDRTPLPKRPEVSLVKEFFSYFTDPDALSKCKTGALLLKLDIEKNLLPVDLIFFESKANKIVKKLGKDHTDVKDFMNRVKETFVECGKYIQSKLPLENETLKAFTAIDPLLSPYTSSYCFGR